MPEHISATRDAGIDGIREYTPVRVSDTEFSNLEAVRRRHIARRAAAVRALLNGRWAEAPALLELLTPRGSVDSTYEDLMKVDW